MVDFGVVEGGKLGCIGVGLGLNLGAKLGLFILQSVCKKTTHRDKKKLGFSLWFFPPPIYRKIRIFWRF